MRLIDSVDETTIIRKASYGMLQDELSKYSLNMMKINVKNVAKPKIYNIKSNIDPSLVGMSNSMGRITKPISISKANEPRFKKVFLSTCDNRVDRWRLSRWFLNNKN